MADKTTAGDIAKGITGAFLMILAIKFILVFCAIAIFCIYIMIILGIFMPTLIHPAPYPTLKP